MNRRATHSGADDSLLEDRLRRDGTRMARTPPRSLRGRIVTALQEAAQEEPPVAGANRLRGFGIAAGIVILLGGAALLTVAIREPANEYSRNRPAAPAESDRGSRSWFDQFQSLSSGFEDDDFDEPLLQEVRILKEAGERMIDHTFARLPKSFRPAAPPANGPGT